MVRRLTIAAFVLSLLYAQTALAETSVSAYTDRRQMYDNETLTLTVSFSTDDSSDVQDMLLPKLDDFEILGKQQSTSTQIVFTLGKLQKSTVKRYILTLAPKRTGNLTIPPAVMKMKSGRTYKSNPITISVIASGAIMPPQAQGGTNNQPQPNPHQQTDESAAEAQANGLLAPLSISERRTPNLFVRTVIDKAKAYIGQQITVSYYLYTRRSISDANITKRPSYLDCWTEPIDIGRRAPRQTIYIDGRRYTVFLMEQVALFPKRAGRLEIGPLEIEVLTDVGFFSTGRRFVRTTQPVYIDILPLPEENQPEDFSPANVGRFTYNATLDKQETEVGEPITLTLTVSGEGNIKAIRMPEPKSNDDFKVYPPTFDDSSTVRNGKIIGTKRAEILVVPKREGELKLELPAFSWFDPEAERYNTIKPPAFTIHVRPGKGPGPTASGTNPQAQRINPDMLKPIKFSPSLSPAPTPFATSTTFYVLVWGAPALVVLLYLFLGMARLLGHMRQRASENAARRVKNLIADSRHFLQAKELANALSSIERALLAAVEARHGTSLRGVPTERIPEVLEPLDIPQELKMELAELLAKLEEFRFAPLPPSESTCMEIIDRGESVARRLLQ